jgi:O-antigen ligase
MAYTLNELIVVSAIALIIFRLAKPIALRFSDERDFSRRRNVWLVLTLTAFLSPNFWIFTLVAMPLMIWAGRKDKNPVALYLVLLHVIPPVPIEIPVAGLFNLDNYRLLSLCILIPAAWRLRKAPNADRKRGIASMDLLLLSYGALKVFLFVPPDSRNYVIFQDSLTNEIRSAFLFLIDIYVLYYTVSRTCSNRRSIAEAQAAFCLSCAVMAALAVFETLRHWLPYVDIAMRWTGDLGYGFYRARGGWVRAQVSSGNALALAYMLALACGFWLYLQSHVKSKPWRIGVMVLLWLGLLATFSRGPWLGAAVIYVVVGALGTRSFSKLFKGALATLLLITAIAQTPLGDRIADLLPFSKGSADTEAGISVTYRKRLFERSWEVFKEHPFFGDQNAFQKLADLRQGEGIIDMVNTYVQVGVFYGFIGLTMFVGFILIALVKVYRRARRLMPSDADLGLMGVGLVGCMVGTLFMLATTSFILSYEKLFYVIAGLAAAYTNLGETAKQQDTKGLTRVTAV